MALTARQVATLRVISQGLVGERAGDIVQAQDWKASRTALALRRGVPSVGIDEAANAGAIVRTWPMRGTLHWVPARDAGWLVAISQAATKRAAAARLRQLAIADADIDRCESLVPAEPLTRAALFALWNGSGIETTGQRGIHLIQQLALRGVLVLGPVIDGVQRFVRADRWIDAPRSVTREAGIVELGRRYLDSHGPASMRDFLWWAGLLVRDVRELWPEITAGFEPVSHDGRDLWVAPDVLDSPHRRSAGSPLLLPAFDELIIGYADRSPTVPSGHFEKVVPDRNGYFLPTVVHGGVAVATWKNSPTGPAITAFEGSLPAPVERALPRLWDRYRR